MKPEKTLHCASYKVHNCGFTELNRLKAEDWKKLYQTCRNYYKSIKAIINGAQIAFYTNTFPVRKGDFYNYNNNKIIKNETKNDRIREINVRLNETI